MLVFPLDFDVIVLFFLFKLYRVVTIAVLNKISIDGNGQVKVVMSTQD